MLDLILEQLGEQLSGDVLVLQAAYFGEEFVGQDRDVRALDARSGEEVDDLVFGGDGLRDELPDGVAEVFLRLPFAGGFDQGRSHGLEEGDVVAEADRFTIDGGRVTMSASYFL